MSNTNQKTGATAETRERQRLLFPEAVRSVFTLLTSITIAYVFYQMTDDSILFIFYCLYPALVLLILNSTWNLLDCWTAYAEVATALASERATWKVLEEDLYKNATWLNTGPLRNLCILEKKIHHSTTSTNNNKNSDDDDDDDDDDTTDDDDKPVFLFVHGSMARMGQYAALMKLVAAKGFNYVTYDFFGMGRSPKPENSQAYTTAALHSDLLCVYEYTCKMYPKRPVIVVGHSYGCCLTLKLCMTLNDPLEDTGSLLSPGALVLLGAYRWNSLTAKSKSMVKLFSLPLWCLRIIRPFLSAGFKSRAFSPASLNNPSLKSLMDYADAVSGANLFHVVQPFYCSSGTQLMKISELEQFTAPPTFLVTGEHDKIAVVEEAEKLGKLLRSSSKGVTIVKAAGHQVMEEQPDRVYEILELATRACISTK
jgi:pimeloyl-ACP methyl ester carboxylesterase